MGFLFRSEVSYRWETRFNPPPLSSHLWFSLTCSEYSGCWCFCLLKLCYDWKFKPSLHWCHGSRPNCCCCCKCWGISPSFSLPQSSMAAIFPLATRWFFSDVISNTCSAIDCQVLAVPEVSEQTQIVFSATQKKRSRTDTFWISSSAQLCESWRPSLL